MIKKLFIIFAVLFLLSPVSLLAQTDTDISGDKVFTARVKKILEEKSLMRDDGSEGLQQNLLLEGLKGEWKGREFQYYGISQIDLASANEYRVGDKVLVSEVIGVDEKSEYYVVDFVRTGYLFWLAVIFSIIIFIIGRKKGLKAFLGLIVSFVIIIKIIIPKIFEGGNPVFYGVFGALVILGIIIYLTEGWNRKSHISIVSVFFSLLIIYGLSSIFTYLTKLTGLAHEEAVFLLGSNGGMLDFRGLLLAGILIGAVGVLDDVIVGQVESVRQIKIANPGLSNRQVFKSAYEVGNTHLGAIINTLFLTYAGASLPLLLLFYTNPSGTASFSLAVNNELIATEIIRTLVGSIGVALSMPISTYLASILIRTGKIRD